MHQVPLRPVYNYRRQDRTDKYPDNVCTTTVDLNIYEKHCTTTIAKTVKFDYHRRVQLQLRERLLPLRHEYNYFHYEMYHYRRHVNNYFPR